ncbi:MAG TPA: Ig-like domain-containing protein, partial [Gemmatimonadaceae bacterium]|nr:Ig-like domain-containing protein [Gemmatimonadaceae bacterium]
MRARHSVLLSLCVSLLALSAACKETISPGDAPPADTTPAVVAVVIFPGKLALETGADTSLVVAAMDSTNHEIGAPPPATWATSDSTVATVSAEGVVKAMAAGSATITATIAGKQGMSDLTVADTQPAASPSQETRTADECGTPQDGWLWCDDFEQNRLGSYFEYVSPDSSFVRRSGVGVDSSYGMLVHFTQGRISAGALHLAFGKVPAGFTPVHDSTTKYREIYWRMYVRNQPGWTGGGGDKLSRAITFAGSNWSEAMMAQVWSGSKNPNVLVMDPSSGTDTAGTLQTTKYNDFDHLRWLGAQASNTPIFDSTHVGQWHCVEAHAKLNDPGQSNGSFELWIDGALEAQETTLNWLGSYSDYGINAVFFENYWNKGS